MLLYVSLLDSRGSAPTNAVRKKIIPIRFFIIIPSDFRKHGLLLIDEGQHTCYVYTEAVISFNNNIIFFYENDSFLTNV